MVLKDSGTTVALIGLFAAPIAAFTGWFLNRRKDDNAISASITASANDAVNAIKETMEVLQESLHEAQEEVKRFKSENERLTKAIEQLENDNKRLSTDKESDERGQG